MALRVNGELVSDELVAQEVARLAKLPAFHERPHEVVRLAESTMIDRTIVRQISEIDSRPLDPAEVESAFERYRSDTGCGAQINDASIRHALEGQLRLARTQREMIGETPKPSVEDIYAFYNAHKHRFRTTETAHVSHIVVNVDGRRNEEEARSLIERAEEELAQGAPFAEVVGRYSDCKDKGGELDPFPRGVMVEEFENVVFNLEPGIRSTIFRTPFGFHIAELKAKIEIQPCDIKFVSPDIEAYLLARSEAERLGRALGYLRANSVIERVESDSLAAATSAS